MGGKPPVFLKAPGQTHAKQEAFVREKTSPVKHTKPKEVHVGSSLGWPRAKISTQKKGAEQPS